MKKILLFLIPIIFFFGVNVFAKSKQNIPDYIYEGPKPIFAYSVWIGWTPPYTRFVIYDNGDIVFINSLPSTDGAGYKVVHLSEDTFTEIKKKFVVDENLISKDGSYSTEPAIDGIEHGFYYQQGGKDVFIHIRGFGSACAICR